MLNNKALHCIARVLVCVVLAAVLIILAGGAQAESQNIDASPEITGYRYTQEQAHAMADAARNLGYPEDCHVIQLAQDEWADAQAYIEACTLLQTYTISDVKMLANMAQGEAGALPDTERAACIWTALNRLDNGYDGQKTIQQVITAPGQYAAYYAWATPTEENLSLARDVMLRWLAEKAGIKDAGRVLPADYMWFCGDGHHNYFRNADKTIWDWSLPSPYTK